MEIRDACGKIRSSLSSPLAMSSETSHFLAITNNNTLMTSSTICWNHGPSHLVFFTPQTPQKDQKLDKRGSPQQGALQNVPEY